MIIIYGTGCAGVASAKVTAAAETVDSDKDKVYSRFPVGRALIDVHFNHDARHPKE